MTELHTTDPIEMQLTLVDQGLTATTALIYAVWHKRLSQGEKVLMSDDIKPFATRYLKHKASIELHKKGLIVRKKVVDNGLQVKIELP